MRGQFLKKEVKKKGSCVTLIAIIQHPSVNSKQFKCKGEIMALFSKVITSNLGASLIKKKENPFLLSLPLTGQEWQLCRTGNQTLRVVQSSCLCFTISCFFCL